MLASKPNQARSHSRKNPIRYFNWCGCSLRHAKDLYNCSLSKMLRTWFDSISWIIYSNFLPTGFMATVCTSIRDNRYNCSPRYGELHRQETIDTTVPLNTGSYFDRRQLIQLCPLIPGATSTGENRYNCASRYRKLHRQETIDTTVLLQYRQIHQYDIIITGYNTRVQRQITYNNYGILFPPEFPSKRYTQAYRDRTMGTLQRYTISTAVPS